jgi:hypothetical protein
MDALYAALLPRAHVVLCLAQVAPRRVFSHDCAFFGRFLCLLCVCRGKDGRPLSFVTLTVAQWQAGVAALASSSSSSGSDGRVVIASESFKTQDTYGFDTLLFRAEEAALISLYLVHVRPLCFGGKGGKAAARDTARPLLVNSQGGTPVRDFSRKLVALTELLGRHITANRWCVSASVCLPCSASASLPLPLCLLGIWLSASAFVSFSG